MQRHAFAATIFLLGSAGSAFGQAQTDWGACQSFCSKTEPGNTLLEVLLLGRPGAGNTAAAAARALEITTYVDGFDRNRFLVLPFRGVPGVSRRESGAYSTSRVPRPVRDAPSPGLESLSFRSVSRPTETSLILSLPAGPPDDRDILVTLDQAEAGRTYFVRPSGSSAQPLVCRAAICPTDFVPEPAKGGR